MSSRSVISDGVVLLAGGFFLSSLASSSLEIFLLCFCSLVGIGVGLVYVPAVATVQRWFVKNRNQASGIALAGTGVGTFIGLSAAGLFMKHVSWESTMQIFAVVIAVVGLLAASLIKGSPRELGLVADGFATCETTVELPAPRGMGLSAAMGTKQLWSYFCAIFFGSVGLFLALIHINPYARQFGFSSSQANLLIGMIGVGNIAGRLLLGRLGDRIGARQLLISLTGALVLLNLFWLAAHTFETMVLFALLFGAANGGCISLYPSLAEASRGFSSTAIRTMRHPFCWAPPVRCCLSYSFSSPVVSVRGIRLAQASPASTDAAAVARSHWPSVSAIASVPL